VCKASKFFSILFVISLWSFLSSAMDKWALCSVSTNYNIQHNEKM
jgi:hypothetical protein